VPVRRMNGLPFFRLFSGDGWRAGFYGLFAVLLATAAPGANAQPSFPTQTEEAFNKIEVQGGGTLLVDFGEASRAELVDGPSSDLRISVQSGTLRVQCATPCRKKLPGVVRVMAPALTSIRVNGGGSVEIRPGFPVTLVLSLEIRGGGAILAGLMRVETVTANIAGGGAVTVFAMKSLRGLVSDGGSVKYFGDPEIQAQTKDGGTVRRLGSSPGRRDGSAFVDARDGNRYETVLIDGHMWMARNLAFLPRVCRADDVDCGIWVYNFLDNDHAAARATEEYREYGALYSWTEALKACPAGWHLPSDKEWQVLEVALGMTAADAGSSVWRGTDEGARIKAGGGSGLDVLLAGWRTSSGKFNFAGEHANFWTATAGDAQHGIERLVGASRKQIGRHTGVKGCGFSVRCVRD
jgi:uncharacterized protein (TIGR02145 family)